MLECFDYQFITVFYRLLPPAVGISYFMIDTQAWWYKIRQIKNVFS